MIGFLTAEINPSTGLIAAYSSEQNIYIWPRLYDIFKDGHEAAKLVAPLKRINGVSTSISNINMMLVQWSPSGRHLVNASESVAKVLKYQPEEGHSFKNYTEFSADFTLHHRRRGGFNASYACMNNNYCVTSFNLSLNNPNGHSVTQTSLVVFDLEKGEIVHRISQQNTAVNMATNTMSINMHPRYPRVCVTTDIDGQIVFWDCFLGVALRIFIEHAAHIGQPLETNSVSDCNFSKCGNWLVAGTNYGSVSIYGYGGSECFEHIDGEQFTLSDYSLTSVLPDSYQIVDTDTGLEVDPERPAQKCAFNLVPHQVLPSSSTYVQARQFIDDKTTANRSKLSELRKADDAFQLELLSVMTAERKKAEDIKKKLKEGGDISKPKERRIQENAEVERVQDNIGQMRYQPQQIDQDSSDESIRGRRRLRRAQASESSVSEDELEEDEGDNDLDLDSLESEEGMRRRSSRLMRHTLRTNRPTQRNGPRTRRAAQLEAGHLGKRDIVETSDADSQEFYQVLKRKKKEDQAKETPVIEEELFCTRCRQVGAREKCTGPSESEPCGSIFHHHCSDLCGADLKDRFICFDCLLVYYSRNPNEFEYPKSELEDAWLDIQGPDPDLITPQIGDRYYFVFQAYEIFVSQFFDILNFSLEDTFWPWRKYPYFQEREVACQVTDIEYEFPRLRGKKIYNEKHEFLTIIMRIKMKILTPETMDEMDDKENQSFEIRYFPANNWPSFLIWHSSYEKSVKDYFAASTYSEIKSGTDYFNIKEKSFCEESFPNTLYKSIKARPVLEGISTRRREQSGPEGGKLGFLESCFSPWEVEFKPGNYIPTRLHRKGEEQRMPPLICAENEPGPSPEVIAAIVRFMKEQGKNCYLFMLEVDKKAYKDYTEKVKVEMYFSKIYRRLVGGYYRSLDSLKHDLNLIVENAVTFNGPNSKIALQANCIVQYLTLEIAKADNPEEQGISRRESEKLLRQISSFGLVDKNFDFERDIEKPAADAFKEEKVSVDRQFRDEDTIVKYDDKDAAYRSRLRRTAVASKPVKQVDSDSDDERPNSRRRTRKHIDSFEFDEDERQHSPQLHAGGQNRAERRMQRHRSPPQVNGMKLRHRS